MLISSSAALYFAALGWAVVKHIKRRDAWELMPSGAWSVLMVLPFSIQQAGFSQQHLPIHALGLFLVGGALLVGDTLQIGSKTPQRTMKDSFQTATVAYVIMLAVLLLQASHLCLMPQIPLLAKYFGKSGSSSDLVALREASSKYLEVSPVYIYLCYASLIVLAPLGVAMLIRTKRWFPAGLLFVTSLFYSGSTLEKSPLYVFLVLCFIFCFAGLQENWRRRLLRWLVGGAILGGSVVAHFLIFNERSIFNYQVSPGRWAGKMSMRPPVVSIADRWRIMNIEGLDLALSPFQRTVNYCIYRVFLAPVEVSHWWYLYYPEVHGSYLGWDGLTPSSRKASSFQHPANRLGRWAYLSRYPSLYRSSLHAYASVDADAYARWGTGGLFIVAWLVLAFRMAIKYFRSGGYWGTCLNIAILFVLAETMPRASLQAALVANGILLYGLIIFFKYIYARWSLKVS